MRNLHSHFTFDISYYITIHHTHEMLKAKHGYMYSLFIEVKTMHYIIYNDSSKQPSMSLSIVASSNMKHSSQMICFLWQKGLMWVYLHSTTYKM